MGKMSKEKGKRFERHVAGLFRDYGYEAYRTAQYKGNTGDAGDVEGEDEPVRLDGTEHRGC